jgi:periplasmic protein TonB
MVLSRAHAFWPQRRPKPIRITGLSVAILINMLAIVLLSLPREAQLLLPVAKPQADVIITDWIRPEPLEEPIELPPMPIPPAPQPNQQTIERPTPPTPVIIASAPSPVSIPVDLPPQPFRGATGDSIEFSLAPTRGQARYVFAPAPPYPGPALRAGAQGTVVLLVTIGIDGRPKQVDIHESSGHLALDRSALEQVQQRWRFEPAMRDGRAIESRALVPVEFRIPR